MGIGTVFIVSDVAFLISICVNIREGRDVYTLLKSYLLLTVQKKLSPLDYSFVHILRKLSPLDFSFVNILKKLSPLHCSFIDIIKMKLLNMIKKVKKKKLHCFYSQNSNRVEWTCTLLMDNCQHNLVNEIWFWNKGLTFNHSLRIIRTESGFCN